MILSTPSSTHVIRVLSNLMKTWIMNFWILFWWIGLSHHNQLIAYSLSANTQIKIWRKENIFLADFKYFRGDSSNWKFERRKELLSKKWGEEGLVVTSLLWVKSQASEAEEAKLTQTSLISLNLIRGGESGVNSKKCNTDGFQSGQQETGMLEAGLMCLV